MSEVSEAATAAATATSAAVKGLVWELKPEEALTYVCISILALIPLYIGCHMSLSQKKASDKPSESGEHNDHAGKIQYDLETMSSSEVWKFPLVGSAFLLGLYIVFKFVNKEYVSLLLNLYLLLFGIASLAACFRPLYSMIFAALSDQEHTLPVYKLKIPYFIKEPLDVTYLDAVNFMVCIGLLAWYLVSKNWIANNLIAVAFAIQGISLVSVGNYKLGCILLSLLFFYDIFWVFGTDVMVTVAKSFDGPIKVLWPKDVLASTYSFSMLGLGDIVIPGMFIALLLRYDIHRSHGKKNVSTPYFSTTFVGYMFGLATTMFVMHVFRAAQPALLYLVPACIIFSAGTALYLGDMSGLLTYTEVSETKEKDKEKTD